MKLQFTLVMFLTIVNHGYCQNNFNDWLNNVTNRLVGQISDLIDNFDRQIGELFSDMRNFSKNTKQMAECYESQLMGQEMDIFNTSMNFGSIIRQYYQSFSNKTISRESIKNLIDSTQDMISRCLNQTNSSSVRFGYTEMSDLSVKQLSDRNGLTTDSSIFSFLQRLFGNRSGGTDDKCKASDQSVPDNFDWRERNAVTSVKDQQDCGSCWAFATVAAIESALIIGNKASVDSIDGSEQNLVNCVSNGCDGGTSYNAFNYVKKNSVGKESNIPYKAKEESCSNPDDTLPIINDYCIRSKRRYTSSMQSESLSDKDMQQTLVKFGPLYIGVDADPLSYRNYRSGIVDDRLCSERINHAVLLVGYTPDAWIIKNSWGKNWGEEGYFRVARGKNMCGVNTEMAWPTPY